MKDMWISKKTGIRRRGTSVSELISLFESGITVEAICEPLYIVAKNSEAIYIANQLSEKDFDVAGLAESEDKPVNGYVRRSDLKKGICRDYLINFSVTDLISEATPLTDVLTALRDRSYLFILENTNVNAIVTRADLQKPAVRILIFGLITLL